MKICIYIVCMCLKRFIAFRPWRQTHHWKAMHVLQVHIYVYVNCNVSIYYCIHTYIYRDINADRSMTIAKKHIMTQNWTWHNHNTSQPNIHPSSHMLEFIYITGNFIFFWGNRHSLVYVKDCTLGEMAYQWIL